MNLTLSDSLLGRQRSRQWSPLVTQQYRLRHIHQIIGLNFPHLPKTAYYYTLHLTTMSAPIYTSEKSEGVNLKWLELDLRNLTNLATTALVLRVWRHCGDTPDNVVCTWGINLSGLIYIGSKIADIQPAFFNPNTVIFNIRGGYFTSKHVLKEQCSKPPPFVDNLNLKEIGGCKKLFKKTSVKVAKSEIRNSYNIDKLRKLHSLQVTIRNKSLDVQGIREKIEIQCGMTNVPDIQKTPESTNNSSPSNIRYAPQLLTMKSVNKMLEQKPTKMQKKEMEKLRNEIEIEQFRSKLLSQERDKKTALIRRLKNKLKDLVEENEKKSLDLMDNYYQLRRDSEKLKELKKQMVPNQELLVTLYSQLYKRRRQLLQQLLFIYPIQQVSDKKFTIHGIYVPNSDILTDCSDAGISVALGYITHILLMSSMFLQVPLRYPMTHYGSRSYITDHISPILPDREREFPLFTKGKEKIQFTYAVYLLNKNIAQLRWLFFMHTPELKATLPNLLTFLEGRDCKETLPLVTCSLGIKNELEYIRVEEHVKLNEERFRDLPKKYKMYRSCESGPGLSEILAIPEAFMNKQITSDSFKSYAASKNIGSSSASICIKQGIVDEINCDNNEEIIEQGTDLLDPSVDLTDLESEEDGVSGTGDNHSLNGGCSEDIKESQNEILEKWMKNGTSSECCSNDGSLLRTCERFAEISVTSVQNVDSPLMARTDALLNTKSFNLVKPKSSL